MVQFFSRDIISKAKKIILGDHFILMEKRKGVQNINMVRELMIINI
jgi:hypothetical protein